MRDMLLTTRGGALALTALILATALAGAASHAAAPNPDVALSRVVIEVSGTVPGFADAHQLAATVATDMEKSAPRWHFVPGSRGESLPVNRVEWTFSDLKTVWKGGGHKGFSQPTISQSYLSAEAKLYLGNTYQVTVLSHPTIVGGPEDSEFAAMVTYVTSALVAEADRP